ncbi:MAG: type II toxin-antitoxin system VapC family toxin [Gemmatimonadaceae bacterium]
MPISDPMNLPFLLDTHIWVWAWERNEHEMSPRALEIVGIASQRGLLLVSAISMWEIAMLVEKRRITLSKEPYRWIEEAITAPGVQVIGLTPEIAVGSTRLPGKPHGDPADRILMATARAVGARLVTSDRQILAYAERERALSVIDARR